MSRASIHVMWRWITDATRLFAGMVPRDLVKINSIINSAKHKDMSAKHLATLQQNAFQCDNDPQPYQHKALHWKGKKKEPKPRNRNVDMTQKECRWHRIKVPWPGGGSTWCIGCGDAFPLVYSIYFFHLKHRDCMPLLVRGRILGGTMNHYPAYGYYWPYSVSLKKAMILWE